MHHLSIKLLLLFMLAFCGEAAGQSSIMQGLRGSKAENARSHRPGGAGDSEYKKIVYIESAVVNTPDRWSADTVYYTDAARSNDWLAPAGEAVDKRRAPVSDATLYRFTKKNAEGHYLTVECLRGGRPVASPKMGAAILPVEKFNYSPSLAKDILEWAAREDSVWRVDFVPVSSGERPAQETATSLGGTRAHVLFLERISPLQSVGFYTDGALTPIELTSPNMFKAPTCIHFTYTAGGELESASPVDGGGWPISEK